MKIAKLVVGILLLVLAAWLLVEVIVNGILGIGPIQIISIILSRLFIDAGGVYIVQENNPFLNDDIINLILFIIGENV